MTSRPLPATAGIPLFILAVILIGGIPAAALANLQANPAASSPPGAYVIVGSEGNQLEPGGQPLQGLAGQATTIAATDFLTGSSGSATHTAPSARYGEAMAFDPKDGYVVMFGGYNESRTLSTAYLHDTWEFSNGVWKELHPPVSPPSRAWAKMTYDAADGYVLLFGGSGYPCCNGLLSDTWKFSNGIWTELFPNTHPSARTSFSMTYDPADRYVLLFGGYTRGGSVAETWTYEDGNWTHLLHRSSPPTLTGASMAYDAADGYVLMFGGWAGAPARDSHQSWEFVHGKWTELVLQVHPRARTGAVMTFDPKVGGLVLFGGETFVNNSYNLMSLNGTWEFKNGTWTLVNTSTFPPANTGGAFVFDSKAGYPIIFGGFTTSTSYQSNETWKFVHSTWVEVQ
jgi:Galactose oxidase, central domain